MGDSHEEAFAHHIEQTLEAARRCHLVIIFGEVYALNGDTARVGRAVHIVRQLI